MFLVFTPLPYVDATSAWAFGSKWRRAMVGMAGMLVEMFFAAIAAIAWTQTPSGTPLHGLCFNIMFIAGVSTLIFNGNPLLRYDGYYILSDLLEIPNLWQRSREYLYYLVKKYAWGVRRPRSPSQLATEKIWLSVFAVASTIYRFIIYVAILLFVASALPVVGMVLAIAAGIAGLVVPVVKFLHYLLLNSELFRVRTRAMLTTAATLVALVLTVGVFSFPEHIKADGLSRADQQPLVYSHTDGFLESYLPSFARVWTGQTLLQLSNPLLEPERENAKLEILRLKSQHDQQIGQNHTAEADQTEDLLKAAQAHLDYVNEQIDRLEVTSSCNGIWYTPKLDYQQGAFLKAGGDPIGIVVDLDNLLVEAFVTQDEAARIFSQAGSGIGEWVDLALPGRPDITFRGQIIDKVPAGQRQLPSAALSTAGGGQIPLSKEGKGETAAPVFTVVIKPDLSALENGKGVSPLNGQPVLRSKQRVAVRFNLPARPLAVRWYRAILQLLQKF
jgi:putative peptide zinc metalloprotease protein